MGTVYGSTPLLTPECALPFSGLQENKGNIFEFLAGLCGVVGGVVTVLGLFEGFVHHSAKAVIGKKD